MDGRGLIEAFAPQSVWARSLRFNKPAHRPQSIDTRDPPRLLLTAEPPDQSHTRSPTRDVDLATLLVAIGTGSATLDNVHPGRND